MLLIDCRYLYFVKLLLESLLQVVKGQLFTSIADMFGTIMVNIRQVLVTVLVFHIEAIACSVLCLWCWECVMCVVCKCEIGVAYLTQGVVLAYSCIFGKAS